MAKSLAILQGLHELKDDIGLMTLAPDVAERVTAELGWLEGRDFKRAPPPPPQRDYLFVGSRSKQHG